MNGVSVSMQIPEEQLLELLRKVVPVDRTMAMVDRLGEACTKATAARTIGCSPTTINQLVEDGRISLACEGTRIDVRSLAAYIERKSEADHAARMQKKGRKSYV